MTQILDTNGKATRDMAPGEVIPRGDLPDWLARELAGMAGLSDAVAPDLWDRYRLTVSSKGFRKGESVLIDTIEVEAKP